MNWRKIVGISATTALGMSLFAGSGAGQQQSLTQQFLGTWTLVSHESVSMYGPNPKGVAFLIRMVDSSSRSCAPTVLNTQLTTPHRVQQRKIKQRPNRGSQEFFAIRLPDAMYPERKS